MTVSRAMLLCGTDEAALPPRVLRAGPLTVELEAGNLRYIRLGGVEMIRAVSFLVRSRAWATFAPEITDLDVQEDGDTFHVTYRAIVRDGAAVLRYAARITGHATGALSFAVDAHAESAFDTCRSGFVVLHPIAGVAGQPVEVEHVDGSVVRSHFPALIDPVQPMLNLRALTHNFAPGARVTCRMDGDVFEMEDQRNWTDASYKTYSRPLALPWPYTLAAGERLSQSVTLSVQGNAPAQAEDDVVGIEIGAAIGTMPPLALGCDPAEAGQALSHVERLRAAGIASLVCRFDRRAGHNAASLATVASLADQLGVPVELQLVVNSVDAWAQDIADAAEQVRQAGLTPSAIAVSPAADLKSTSPGSAWPPCPPADAVLRAARQAFVGVRLGGGMLSYFTELNRKRPPNALIDFVTFSTSALVHAGDDRSAMETLEALPAIAASTRAIASGLPFMVGPSAIGMRDNPYGAGPLPNPGNARMAMAGHDPRHLALFNAAWTLGYIARLAAGGAARIAVSAPLGDFGILGDAGPYPVFHVLQGLAALRGAALHGARTTREHDVLALLAADAGSRTLWLANLTAAPITVAVPGQLLAAGVHVLDAACGPGWDTMRAEPDAGATLALDAYAVAVLRLGKP
jgi:D-apionolactonase